MDTHNYNFSHTLKQGKLVVGPTRGYLRGKALATLTDSLPANGGTSANSNAVFGYTNITALKNAMGIPVRTETINFPSKSYSVNPSSSISYYEILDITDSVASASTLQGIQPCIYQVSTTIPSYMIYTTGNSRRHYFGMGIMYNNATYPPLVGGRYPGTGSDWIPAGTWTYNAGSILTGTVSFPNVGKVAICLTWSGELGSSTALTLSCTVGVTVSKISLL